jgi:phosphatidylserine/phosphatidylglycerophosphate/cardiolipin synthase-like enzyme
VFERGQLTASAEGRFFGSLSALHIENAEIDANLQGFDALFSVDGCRLRIDGMVRAALAMQGVEFDSQRGVVSGMGTVSHGLDPRSKLLRHNDVTLLNRTIDFTLREDGTLAIRPDRSGLKSFFAPFAKIGGSPERLTDPIASGPAPVGSEAMQNHIAELCNAPVSTFNRIELLVDGVQSFPMRMEMISQAEASICMQTLIFKEDETGLETANALIDAASRGVQVNVIIDALGNCETFEHVHKGRPLYEMLREGGVHLALYNDPRTSGLMDVLDALKQVSRLTEVRSPVDLQNPALALQVASSLIKVLKPDGAELDSTARNVLVGLARLGLIKSSEVVGDTFEFSTGSVVDKGQALFLGKLMAEMNHRWHEKYLVVDRSKAIVGGMNTADEYLKGGSGRIVRTLGAERVAWRDTDMFVEGPVAENVFSCFADNFRL